MVKLTWIKHALRSFVVRPLSTGLFIFIVLCASILFLVLNSANDTMYSTLIYNNQEQFQNTDIVIELGNNYEQRFFWLQPLNALSDRFEDIVPILVYPARTVDGSNVIIHFTKVDEYRKIVNLPNEPISYHEIYVVGEIASNQKFIQIPLNDEIIDLEIKGNVPYNQITLNSKQPIIVVDINLAKTFFNMNIDDMYNQVFLKLKSGIDEANTINELQRKFPNQVVKSTKNRELIAQSAQHFSVSIQLITSLTIVPLTLSLLLLSRINFKKNEQEMLILRILGASIPQCFIFFFLEYLIYLMIGFVLALPVWQLITKLMVSYLSNTSSFLMVNPWRHIGLSFVLVLVYLVVLFIISFTRLVRSSYQTARSNLDFKYENVPSKKQQGVILISLVLIAILWISMQFIIFPQLAINLKTHLLKGFIGLGISIVLCILLLKVFSIFIYKLFPHDKRFTIIEGREIAYHKLTFWFHVMMLFSIITVSYALFSYKQIGQKASYSGNNLNYNIAINNITINHQQFDTLLDSYQEVEWYEKGFSYYSVYLPQYQSNLPMVISIDPTSLEHFLDFEIEEISMQFMQSRTELAIMLSTKYQTVYGLKIGDEIELQVNLSKPAVKYKVAGFVPEELDIYAISNIYQNAQSTSNHEFNSIYLKCFDQNYLVKDLQSKLAREGVTVTLKKTTFSTMTEWLFDNQNFFKLFIIIVSCCLLLMLFALFGFIYLDRMRYFTLLKILGDMPSLKETFKRIILVLSIIFVMSLFTMMMIENSITALIRYSKTEFSLQGIYHDLLIVFVGAVLLLMMMNIWEWYMKRKQHNFRRN